MKKKNGRERNGKKNDEKEMKKKNERERNGEKNRGVRSEEKWEG